MTNSLTHEWTELRSPTIAKVKFIQNKHDLRGNLHVLYRTDKEYRFMDVPGILIEQMMEDAHPSSYFMEMIRGEFKSEAVK